MSVSELNSTLKEPKKATLQGQIADLGVTSTFKQTLNFRPIYFYAWLDPETGEIAEQRGYKNPDPLAEAQATADWMSISTFRSAWFVDPNTGEHKLGKCKSNISSILGCFSDIDGDPSLTEAEILQRCRAHGLADPTITRTSPGHYHVVFEFKDPLVINNMSLLDLWELVQGVIYDLFKDVGADLNAKDCIRYLRNPHKKDAVNYKYPDRPPIKVVHRGGKTSLSDLYYALKDSGLIPKKAKAQPKTFFEKNHAKGRVARLKLRTFLKQHPSWTGTYKALFSMHEVAERTGYLIISQWRAQGVLQTENIRKGKTWVTKFVSCFDTAIKSSTPSSPPFLSLYSLVLNSFLGNGTGEDFRNNTVFVLGGYLKARGRSKTEAVAQLEPGFLRSFNGRTHVFDRGEFEETVSNSFKYPYCHSYHSDRFLKVLTGLGLGRVENEVLRGKSASLTSSLQCEAEAEVGGGTQPGLVSNSNFSGNGNSKDTVQVRGVGNGDGNGNSNSNGNSSGNGSGKGFISPFVDDMNYDTGLWDRVRLKTLDSPDCDISPNKKGGVFLFTFSIPLIPKDGGHEVRRGDKFFKLAQDKYYGRGRG